MMKEKKMLQTPHHELLSHPVHLGNVDPERGILAKGKLATRTNKF